MISPTGQKVRGWDKFGSGAYGAPRGGRPHKGVDFICKPGQSVMSPITGVVVREARPYAQGPFSGLVIENDHVKIKMFYLEPDLKLVGQQVPKGRFVGLAQDIGEKHPGIKPHIHLEVDRVDPSLFLDMP